MEDYEKKYNEALERAKNYTEGHTLDVNPQRAMEYIFPEIRETESERIRKAILSTIKSQGFISDEETLRQCVAWLEKPANEVEPKFKVGDIVKDTEDGEIFTIRTVTKDKYIYTDDSFDWIKDQDVYELVEQKPAWSEEDEDALDIAIRIIQNGGDNCAGILDSNKALSWVKSLKERLGGEQ